MNTTRRSHWSVVSRSVVMALVMVALAPAIAFAGGQAPARQAPRKVYYIFTTGSHMPVPVDRFRGAVATTAENEQIIHITDRNRTLDPTLLYLGHRF